MLDIKKLLTKVLESLCTGWFYANSVTSTTMTATNTAKQVPITNIHSDSRGFSYNSTNKGITCNKAGQYMISCSLSANPATSGDLMGVAIYKNGVQSVGPEYTRVGGNYDIVVLPPTPITLAEGDVLTLYGKNNTSARGAFTACRFSAWQVVGGVARKLLNTLKMLTLGRGWVFC